MTGCSPHPDAVVRQTDLIAAAHDTRFPSPARGTTRGPPPRSRSKEPELQISPTRSPRRSSVPSVVLQVISNSPPASPGLKLPGLTTVHCCPQPLPRPCPLRAHSCHPVPRPSELLRVPGSVPRSRALPACPARPVLVAAGPQRVPGNFRAGNFPAVVKSRAPPRARDGVRNGIPRRITRRRRHARPARAARKPRERTRAAAAAAGGLGLRDPPAPGRTHFVLGAQVLQGGARRPLYSRRTAVTLCLWVGKPVHRVPGVIGNTGNLGSWAVKPAQSDALSQSEAVAALSLRSKPQKLSKEWVGCRGTAHKYDSYDVPTKEAEQRQRRWDAKPHFRKQS